MLRQSIFYYGVHTPAIDARIIEIRPRFVIVNTLHGLWGEIHGKSVLQDIALYKAAGIKVVGYVTAGYEGIESTGSIAPEWFTLETNERLIKNMAEFDGVAGVFIDECSAFPSRSSQRYLKTLTDLAHSYNLITWGNVGRSDFDPWFFTEAGFDLMHSSEDWRGQTLSPVQREWGTRISVTGSNPSYTARDASRLTVRAWQMGLAYCYISDTAYTSIPSWLEEYAVLISRAPEAKLL